MIGFDLVDWGESWKWRDIVLIVKFEEKDILSLVRNGRFEIFVGGRIN